MSFGRRLLLGKSSLRVGLVTHTFNKGAIQHIYVLNAYDKHHNGNAPSVGTHSGG